MNYGLLLLGGHSRERLSGLARQFPMRPMMGVIGTAPVGECVNKSIDLKNLDKGGRT